MKESKLDKIIIDDSKKTVLITGSSTGIGFSCLELFFEKGWNILAHYYKKTQQLTKKVKRNPLNNIITLESDFSDLNSLNNFLQIIKDYDIDALVNLAGMYDESKKTNNRIESANIIMTVNTIAPILIAETVMENMIKNKNGAIVNISSIGVKFGSGLDNIFYGTSKIGLEAATRSLAREGARYNVLVNALRPGVTDTEFYSNIGKNISERVLMIPLKRAAKPIEIAKYIYFLCNDNTYITNEVLSIAGGE